MPAPSPNRALLEVRDLTVSYSGSGKPRLAVGGLNFNIAPGEVLGIQGPSGCGKTSTALALLNLLPADVEVTGSVLFQNKDLLTLSESVLRKIRGREIAIVYQEPGLALNPVMRVGDQIAEVLRAHSSQNSRQRRDRVRQMLTSVRLNPDRFYGAYPHELSGGERHRVVLAQALVCSPPLVIADEPTAGLDPALKREILDLIANLRRESGAAFLLISHDRTVIERLADRRVELPNPGRSHVYAVAPTSSTSISRRPARLSPEAEPLITVRNLSKWYGSRGLFRRKQAEKRGLDCVDLRIPSASLVALVGPSGSGKSTLARCLSLLEKAEAGEIFFAGKNLLNLTTKELREHRPLFQYISQESSEALNPRLTAREAVEEPLLIRGNCNLDERRERAEAVIRQVGLDPETANRSCHEFSGGQRQRLLIARALTLKPRLLILDESLSGLDPETQCGILDLLLDLKPTIAQLLISHDIEFVASHADSIAVMQDGRIVEHGLAKQIAEDPEHWSTEHVLHVAARQELVPAEAE